MPADTIAPRWQLTTKDMLAAMAVDLPEAELDGYRIERFIVGTDVRSQIERSRLGARAPLPGTYTRLRRGNRVWMSDVTAERTDHLEPLVQIADRRARRGVINGLGLGMVVKAALAFDHVEHIDVVEVSPIVAKLVGPTYEATGRVRVHVADAFAQMTRWRKGTRWDVGWSDIWPDLCTDNLPAMARLNRSYGHRCDWHACWSQRDVRAHAVRERMRSGCW